MTRATCKLLVQAHVRKALDARRLAHGCRKIDEPKAAEILWSRVRGDLAHARYYRYLAERAAA